MSIGHTIRTGVAWLLALVSCGCSAMYYRKSADREAAKVISQASAAVPNMDPRFTIETNIPLPLDSLTLSPEAPEYFGQDSQLEVGARVITLEQALGIAVSQSPVYQNRKEIVFLEALDLTLAQYRFTPIFAVRGDAFYESRTRDVAREIDLLTGTQSSLLQRDSVVVRDHIVSGGGDAAVTMLLRTGARLTADFTTDFLRFINGDGRVFTSSRLGGTLTQPLLRGAGYKVTMENLTQAERDMLYALQSFTHFRREFAVQVATAYYQVLQNKDQVRNAWLGLQNFRQNVEREKAFADEGQRTQTSLGQLQQAELSTETQWINAVRNYQQSLDQFKLLIGLPVDSKIILDESDLADLAIQHPEIALEDAIRIAIETRLDLAIVRGQFEDAGRKVGVARNQLLPDLDLIVNASVESHPNKPLDFDFERARWNAGISGGLPLDRKAERNFYRASLITYERAGRQVKLAIDQVKLNIQADLRDLDQAKRSFEIAEVGVSLSERRGEEQELLMELGRGTARDLVDARTDLINARNQRTSAMVRHTLARLEFWRDLGLLYIKENGQWEELERFERLNQGDWQALLAKVMQP